MARRTKEESEATRESVLIAALDLLAEKGYSRTTFTDIAKRIGMTRGAVYWHFDSKSILLAALIDYVHALKKKQVESKIPDIQTVEDLRNACILYTEIVAHDPIVKKFEFFLGYQMEWSEELLEETQKNMSKLRENPLDNFRAHFDQPAIAARLKKGTDVDQLVVILTSFWIGACKMCLGCHFPCGDLKTFSDEDKPNGMGKDFVKTVINGFDLIMNSVLKEEINDE